jgi:hypothetical protein
MLVFCDSDEIENLQTRMKKKQEIMSAMEAKY